MKPEKVEENKYLDTLYKNPVDNSCYICNSTKGIKPYYYYSPKKLWYKYKADNKIKIKNKSDIDKEKDKFTAKYKKELSEHPLVLCPYHLNDLYEHGFNSVVQQRQYLSKKKEQL